LSVRAYSGATNRAAHRTTARMVAAVAVGVVMARVRKHSGGRDPAAVRQAKNERSENKNELQVEPTETKSMRNVAADTMLL